MTTRTARRERKYHLGWRAPGITLCGRLAYIPGGRSLLAIGTREPRCAVCDRVLWPRRMRP